MSESEGSKKNGALKICHVNLMSFSHGRYLAFVEFMIYCLKPHYILKNNCALTLTYQDTILSFAGTGLIEFVEVLQPM